MLTENISPQSVGKIKHPLRGTHRQVRFQIIVERLFERIDALGEGPTALAERAGLERTYITDFLEGRKRSVNGRSRLNRLAAAMRCEPSYLTGIDPVTRTAPGAVPLAGALGTRGKAAQPKLGIPADPRFPGTQSAWAVTGRGFAGIGAPGGSWFLTVDADDYLRTAGGFRAGLIVIAAMPGRGKRDLKVARRLVTFPDRTELHPIDSSGPVYILGHGGVRVEAVVLKSVQELA